MPHSRASSPAAPIRPSRSAARFTCPSALVGRFSATKIVNHLADELPHVVRAVIEEAADELRPGDAIGGRRGVLERLRQLAWIVLGARVIEDAIPASRIGGDVEHAHTLVLHAPGGRVPP